MEFLKKNWMKLIAALLVVAALTLVVIMIINAIPLYAEMDQLDTLTGGLGGMGALGSLFLILMGTTMALQTMFWIMLGIAVSLLTVLAALVLSMLGKGSLNKFVLLGGGVASLALMAVGFIIGLPMLADLTQGIADVRTALAGDPDLAVLNSLMMYNYYQLVFVPIIYAVVFALAPILFGLNKWFVAKD
ncbi:MAG: hypothetical protein FWE53_02735 [Firmicutes bacterium]|nr:hypothetical protein [Bacillota bacterium]